MAMDSYRFLLFLVYFLILSSDTWYTEEIKYLYKKGIVKGYPDGNFHPLDSVTRAEAVTMLGRALNLSGEQSNTAIFRCTL